MNVKEKQFEHHTARWHRTSTIRCHEFKIDVPIKLEVIEVWSVSSTVRFMYLFVLFLLLQSLIYFKWPTALRPMVTILSRWWCMEHPKQSHDLDHAHFIMNKCSLLSLLYIFNAYSRKKYQFWMFRDSQIGHFGYIFFLSIY